MEFTGRIIAVLPERGGISKNGNEWKVQEYVIEDHGQYPRKMCFDVFGADKIAQFNIQMNEELTVSFDVDAREYQGRWYNSIRAWKVDRVAAQQPAAAPQRRPGAQERCSGIARTANAQQRAAMIALMAIQRTRRQYAADIGMLLPENIAAHRILIRNRMNPDVAGIFPPGA